MKTKIAVATVAGKAYFLLINELKERGIDFLSVVPGEAGFLYGALDEACGVAHDEKNHIFSLSFAVHPAFYGDLLVFTFAV